MKKFDKGMLFTGIISLALAMVMGFTTVTVAAATAFKVLAGEGVETVFDLMEYGSKKLDDMTHDGKIVVNEKGSERILVDFNDGIHVNTGEEIVNIDKTGIHVTER